MIGLARGDRGTIRLAAFDRIRQRGQVQSAFCLAATMALHALGFQDRLHVPEEIDSATMGGIVLLGDFRDLVRDEVVDLVVRGESFGQGRNRHSLGLCEPHLCGFTTPLPIVILLHTHGCTGLRIELCVVVATFALIRGPARIVVIHRFLAGREQGPGLSALLRPSNQGLAQFWTALTFAGQAADHGLHDKQLGFACAFDLTGRLAIAWRKKAKIRPQVQVAFLLGYVVMPIRVWHWKGSGQHGFVIDVESAGTPATQQQAMLPPGQRHQGSRTHEQRNRTLAPHPRIDILLWQIDEAKHLLAVILRDARLIHGPCIGFRNAFLAKLNQHRAGLQLLAIHRRGRRDKGKPGPHGLAIHRTTINRHVIQPAIE